MRIGLVVTGGLDRSGRDRVIPSLLNLVERLARANDVTAFVLRYHREPCAYRLMGACVQDLGSPRGLIRQYTALAQALRRHGPFDVLHGYWALPAGILAAALGRRIGRPSVVTFDSGEFVSLPEIDYGLQIRWRHRTLVRTAARLATAVTVCSDYQAGLARRLGVTAQIIPLGIDTVRFAPGLRSEGRPWRLIQIASLNRVKDQTTLLRALRSVVNRIPDVHLDLVGEDTLGGAIRALARDLHLEAHITFHGVLPASAVVSLLQQAHLFVLSSRHEAANVALLEAAACGVPSVGSAVGHLAGWAPDRACAVTPGDPSALADAIVAMLEDPWRRTRLASAARQWTVVHDADWTAAHFQQLYASLAPDAR